MKTGDRGILFGGKKGWLPDSIPPMVGNTPYLCDLVLIAAQPPDRPVSLAGWGEPPISFSCTVVSLSFIVAGLHPLQ